MHIEFCEIANFRKLYAVRVDLAPKTTLFVGANNSGKTSAMVVMRRFLTRRCPFEIHDFTLCHWPLIDALGVKWLAAAEAGEPVVVTMDEWAPFLPTLDMWFHVASDELHHVHDFIPTMDWAGGRLGVRLRYEPKDVELLTQEFLTAYGEAETLRQAAAELAAVEPPPLGLEPIELTIWPTSLMDFLTKRLSKHFAIKAYVLDPAQLTEPEQSLAKLQPLAPTVEPREASALERLVRVHDIPAQRGLGEEVAAVDDDAPAGAPGSRLSEQLKSYWAKHLDPSKGPEPQDLGALRAIEMAQEAFNSRLKEHFAPAFLEVEFLGYPGVTDPRPRFSTRLKAIDGLNHPAAVQFEVDVADEEGEPKPLLRLPEANNGLGYQNLISIIFKLMSFRDAWMRLGKDSKRAEEMAIEPLHLVLVEEPEAHLHVQVQQVFINKAYSVLRRHKDLGDNPKLRTQLVVSTHSSHVAHETEYEHLRYFRRLPAGMKAKVPVSAVINLSQVFGTGSDTEQFVTRYLRAQHADLFFADAAILVEGPAERMLVPNFIRTHYEALSQSYITLLEIGGSHAHRLRPLIEKLGLITLVVTDLDSKSSEGKAAAPLRGAGQTTDNATLKNWLPKLTKIDDLLDAPADQKIEKLDDLAYVRVAYQTPLMAQKPAPNADTEPAVEASELKAAGEQGDAQVAAQQQAEQPIQEPTAAQSAAAEGAPAEEAAYTEARPYTFEDALAFSNLKFFAALEGTGLVRKLREAIQDGSDADDIGKRFFEALRDGKKAEFALDILYAKDFPELKVPSYIAEGLEWLQQQLKKKQVEVLPGVEAQ